ncbi:MAG: hypothetical protein K2K84_01140 [Muribaculaceae bacterium]|nr:hypothetical protein [Muribaculaceae bacterium]
MKAITLIERHVHLTPDSGVTHCRNPFFVPDEAVWWPCTLIGVKIDRLGMKIAQKFSRRYYSEVVTAVHPSPRPSDNDFEWMRDGALIISDTAPRENIDENLLNIFDSFISHVSRYMTLKTGDMIFMPAPVTESPTAIPLTQGMNLSVPDIPDGFPVFTLKVR